MNQANMTLNTKVYAPNGVSNGVAQWANRDGGVRGGFSFVKQTIKDPVSGTQIKIDHSLVVPVTALNDTSCVCAGDVLRTGSAQISIWVSTASTKAERTDLYLRLKDLVLDPQFIAAIEDLEPSVG